MKQYRLLGTHIININVLMYFMNLLILNVLNVFHKLINMIVVCKLINMIVVGTFEEPFFRNAQ